MATAIPVQFIEARGARVGQRAVDPIGGRVVTIEDVGTDEDGVILFTRDDDGGADTVPLTVRDLVMVILPMPLPMADVVPPAFEVGDMATVEIVTTADLERGDAIVDDYARLSIVDRVGDDAVSDDHVALATFDPIATRRIPRDARWMPNVFVTSVPADALVVRVVATPLP